MLTKDIRRKFLQYFKSRGHTIVPSSPVLPYDDPSLLFINAGMNQFKEVFLGKSVRDYSCAATAQKCIRVGGKHNDLENVGHTRRHLTFFEMLGNFSFGDYFKEKAIQLAWEVSTEVFGFEEKKLWPTVFKDDEEAFELWTRYVPAERISRLEDTHNFWAMGNMGPCGPCSEILYDRGPKYGVAKTPLEDIEEERYLEFWNLVFMQYNRDESGALHPLPKPSIDTGAGLERVINLKMNVDSVYDTDLLRSLIAKIEEISGIPYQFEDADRSPAFRVIADHVRCLAFAIADGVQPSNIERGYVLRKVLRRAVRYGRSLGLKEPFLAKMLPRLIDTMGDDYPELKKSHTRMEEILTAEEESFIRTLHRGGNIINQIIERAQSTHRKISGDEAFKLKDTYGFPLEEIMLLAKDAELKVDTHRFEELEKEARERSRLVHKTTLQMAEKSLFVSYVEENGACAFLGYTQKLAKGRVTALVVGDRLVTQIAEGEEGFIILDRTPFYAEKGGQIGDIGTLEGNQNVFFVTDCQSPYDGVIAHIGEVQKGTIKVGQTLTAIIDAKRRQKIANNHTATHLLHWALCHILGEHVKQAGSVVEPNRLRFDFSHHKALTQEEIRQIEDSVNTKIRENHPVTCYELTFEEAQKKEEIKQFFGEKYGARVRVVDMDDSKELCGGTHTSSVGNIGFFRIAKEGSIAAGIRRIEAVTGEEAEVLTRQDEDLLNKIATLLKVTPHRVESRIKKLLEENRASALQLRAAKKAKIDSLVDDLLSKVEKVDGIPLIAAEVTLTPEEMHACADQTISRLRAGVLVLATSTDGRCLVIVRVSDNLINKGIKANEIIHTIAPIIDGGGGGKADRAQAGGKAPNKIREALAITKEILKS